jgi:outer membrane protein assembly factor BamB
MAIIDLGDVSAPDFPEEPLAPPRPLPRLGVVRLLAGALAVVCALALNGSGRPAPPAVTEAWSAEIGLDTWPYAFGDNVLVAHGDPETAPESTSFDLATGQVRWAVEDASLTSWLNPDPDSNQLYTPAKIRNVENEDGVTYFRTDTRALDARTGKVLWAHPGDELAATAGEVLLGDRDDRGRITTLHLVRAADAGRLWDRPIPASDIVVVPDEPRETARIVVKSTTGELTTLRWSDGVPLATRRGTPRPGAEGWGPQVLHGQFYDILTGTPDGAVIAYATDTLAELWRLPISGEVAVQDCGPVLCVTDTHLTSGVDPATGTRRWKLPSGDAAELSGGRVLLSRNRELSASQSVVDATTGRVIGDTPRDVRVLSLDDGRLLALGDTKTAPYRVTISAWDPETGRTTLIGAVPGRSDTCQVHERHLLCTGAGRLGVTDLGR